LLLGDADTAVKEKLVRNLTTLFRSVKTALAKPDKIDPFFASITPLIIGYEKEIKRNWRKVAMLVEHMQNFREWFSPTDLFQRFVPLLVGHLTDGAAALNPQICKTITLFLREFKTQDDCLKVLVAVRGMVTSLAKSKSAAGRIAYIHLVAEALNSFSQEFVKMTLLPALVPLAIDRVVNVRCTAARWLPVVATYPLLAPQVKTSVDGLARDVDADVRLCLDEGNRAAALRQFSKERNDRLVAEEGSYLLSPENFKKVNEYVEKPLDTSKSAAKKQALAATDTQPSAATKRR
jgi:hypothetical protein